MNIKQEQLFCQHASSKSILEKTSDQSSIDIG